MNPTTPRPSRWRKWQPLAMGAASGLLLTLAYPPLRWGLMAWVALIPLYLTVVRGGAKAATLAGWAFGFLLFLVGANWMTELGEVPAAKALPWVVLSLIEATPFLLCALLAGLVLPRLPVWARPVAFASFWVGQEWARSFGPLAFPWFILAATQVKLLPLLQIVELTGQWGLSFAIALANGLLGEAWLTEKRQRTVWASAAVGVPLLVCALGFPGEISVRTQESKARSDNTMPIVGVAQGSYVKLSSYTMEAQEEVMNLYLDLSRQAVGQGGGKTSVVLWPETVVPGYLLDSTFTLPALQDLARSLNVSLIVGTMAGNEQGEHFNTAVLVDSAGEVAGRYDKRRIVPIGEFFPLRGLLGYFYDQYGVPPYDLIPGTKPGVVSLPGLRDNKAGIIICYESVFVEGTRDCVREGANWIALITSDLTFGTTAGPIQHADLAAMRAVETRRWIVRAAATGTSQFISPTGEVVADLPLMARDTLTRPITLRNDRTLFVRWGDWFVIVSMVIAVGMVVMAWQRSRQTSPSVPEPASVESSLSD
jgi:apolipoprotein N-acyltransferase